MFIWNRLRLYWVGCQAVCLFARGRTESKVGQVTLRMCRKEFGDSFTIGDILAKDVLRSDAMNGLYKALGMGCVMKTGQGVYALTQAGIELGMSYREDQKGVVDAAQSVKQEETVAE